MYNVWMKDTLPNEAEAMAAYIDELRKLWQTEEGRTYLGTSAAGVGVNMATSRTPSEASQYLMGGLDVLSKTGNPTDREIAIALGTLVRDFAKNNIQPKSDTSD